MTRYIPSITTNQLQTAFGPVIRSFASDLIPIKIVNALKPQDKALPSTRYSTVNRVIMLCADTTDGRTSYQWLKAGRKVIPGSRPIYIMSPKFGYGTSPAIKGSGSISYVRGYSATILYRREDTRGETSLPFDVEQVFKLPLKKRADEWGIKTSYCPSICLGFTSYTARSRCLRLGSHKELQFLQNLVSTAYSFPRNQPRSTSLLSCPEVTQDLCIRVLGQMLRRKYIGSTHNSYLQIKNYALSEGCDLEEFCSIVIKEVERIIQIILNGRSAAYGKK